MKFLYIDTETTGLKPGINGIVQIAGIVEVEGVVKETFDFKCQPFPGQLVSKDALAITGLTIEQIKTFEDPIIIYKKLETILNFYVDRYDKTDKFYMVGQNPKFDFDFLDVWFNKNGNAYLYAYIFYGKIDIISITTLFKMAGRIAVDNAKLETLARFFNIEIKAHDAMSDITATREIFLRFIDMVRVK